MRADPPLAHGAILQGLWRAAAAGRLPHALLFEGPAGVGKFASARRFALGLVCAQGPGDPCGACGPCKRLLSGDGRGNHPDVHVVDPGAEGEETIKIERIAERDGGGASVEAFLHLRAHEGGYRIVLLREAERMNAAAQNAFLKTLEEPGDATLLVLVSDRPEGLLETIQSRTVRVRFGRLAESDAARLVAAAGVPRADAERLARFSRGAPGAALALAERGGLALVELCAGVLAGEREPLAAAREVFELEGRFAGATPRAEERDRARALLELLLAIVLDAERWAAGLPPEQLAFGSLLAHSSSRRLGERAIDELLELRAGVDQNLQPAALVERALLVLAGGAALPSGGRHG